MSTTTGGQPGVATQERFDTGLAEHEERLSRARTRLDQAQDAADDAARDVTTALRDKVRFVAAVRRHCPHIAVPDGADR
jgi:hypothetical protein